MNAADPPQDADWLQRFYFQRFNARGQLVSLDYTLAELRSRREYPLPVLELLGEMLCAVAMIADGLKWPGSVALQSKGGALRTSVAEHRAGGLLRAIARPATEDGFDLADTATVTELIGAGQLALSLIPPDDDPRSQPYQGLIAWGGPSLAANLSAYFHSSEQLDTHFLLYADGQRARGLLLQKLPAAERQSFFNEDLQQVFWEHVVQRIGATAPSTLLFDSPPEFLSALFLDASKVLDTSLVLAPPQPLEFGCTCTEEKTGSVLRMLGRQDVLELLEERGEIEVVCEFCGKIYRYDALRTHLLLEPDGLSKH